MAGNFRAGAGAETASQGRTAVQGSYVPVRQAPVQQVPAGYQLAYRMGGPYYMYGETPLYGAYYRDGGIVPGQIYGNMRGSREGADMFGFWPTMFQSQPYATASQMYTPGLGVMPLIGYPSKYPHVVMGGYSDYGAGIANQAMGMMLPLLMMGLYRQMFPMMPQAPAQAARAAGSGGKSGGSGGGSGGSPESPKTKEPELVVDFDPYAPGVGWDLRAEIGNELASNAHFLRDPSRPGSTYYGTDNPGLAGVLPGMSGAEVLSGKSVPSQPSATRRQAEAAAAAALAGAGAAVPAQAAAAASPVTQAADNPVQSRPAGKIADPSIQWLYDVGGKIADFKQKLQNAETGYWFLDDLANPKRPR